MPDLTLQTGDDPERLTGGSEAGGKPGLAERLVKVLDEVPPGHGHGDRVGGVLWSLQSVKDKAKAAGPCRHAEIRPDVPEVRCQACDIEMPPYQLANQLAWRSWAS